MVLTSELLTVSKTAEHKSTGDLAVHFWVILDDSTLIKSQLLQKGQILLTIFLKHLTHFTSCSPLYTFSTRNGRNCSSSHLRQNQFYSDQSQLGSSDVSPFSHGLPLFPRLCQFSTLSDCCNFLLLQCLSFHSEVSYLYCSRSSAWLFAVPEFEPRTPLHHCTFSGIPCSRDF